MQGLFSTNCDKKQDAKGVALQAARAGISNAQNCNKKQDVLGVVLQAVCASTHAALVWGICGSSACWSAVVTLVGEPADGGAEGGTSAYSAGEGGTV